MWTIGREKIFKKINLGKRISFTFPSIYQLLLEIICCSKQIWKSLNFSQIFNYKLMYWIQKFLWCFYTEQIIFKHNLTIWIFLNCLQTYGFGLWRILKMVCIEALFQKRVNNEKLLFCNKFRIRLCLCDLKENGWFWKIPHQNSKSV